MTKMLSSLLLLLGCDDEVKEYPGHTTRDDGAPIVPVDTSTDDDTGSDTGDVVVVDEGARCFRTR